MNKPLEDLVVLDLSRYLLGGFVTQYFADFGARVIKIEDTKTGDFTRQEPPMMNGESHYHYAMDRNKESVSFNLKDPEILDVFYSMVKDADIVVENYRPGVTKRLGIDYDTLSKINPGIIYCSFSAYGQNDPRSQTPLHDINIVAETGYYDLNKGNVPVIPQCDFAAAMVGLQSILTTLYTREKTGKGTYIDTSMMDSIIWWHSIVNSRWFFFGKELTDQTVEYPCVGYNIYRTKDNRMLAFGFYEFNFWNDFCVDAGVPELQDKLKATEQQDPGTYNAVRDLVASRTFDEWKEWLSTRNHCIAPVLTKTEAIDKSCIEQPNMIGYNRFPRFGEVLQVNSPHNLGFFAPKLEEATEPPLLGESTRSVLEQYGMAPDAIKRHIEDGTVRCL